LNSLGWAAPRLEQNTSRRPSAENIGNDANDSRVGEPLEAAAVTPDQVQREVEPARIVEIRREDDPLAVRKPELLAGERHDHDAPARPAGAHQVSATPSSAAVPDALSSTPGWIASPRSGASENGLPRPRWL
jgi:hypothetical protein